jgi:hypothetical protein
MAITSERGRPARIFASQQCGIYIVSSNFLELWVPQESSKMFDLAEALARLLSGTEDYAPVVQAWADSAREFEKGLQVFLERIAPTFAALAEIDWVAAKRRLDELPEKSKAAMMLASSQGWFFGWHDSLQSLMELVESLAMVSPTDIDDVMTRYYRENFLPFAKELSERHPDRAAAIGAAVHAHTSLGVDGYLLSVPVFIAQADGLLTEITRVRSAMMKTSDGELQGSKALRERLASDSESLDMIYPLLNLHLLDFMKSSSARQTAAQTSGTSFTALNRHQVMHGELSNYGTEINSLKAFSFLVFVGAHLPIVLERDRVQSSIVAGP